MHWKENFIALGLPAHWRPSAHSGSALLIGTILERVDRVWPRPVAGVHAHPGDRIDIQGKEEGPVSSPGPTSAVPNDRAVGIFHNPYRATWWRRYSHSSVGRGWHTKVDRPDARGCYSPGVPIRLAKAFLIEDIRLNLSFNATCLYIAQVLVGRATLINCIIQYSEAARADLSACSAVPMPR